MHMKISGIQVLQGEEGHTYDPVEFWNQEWHV